MEELRSDALGCGLFAFAVWFGVRIGFSVGTLDCVFLSLAYGIEVDAGIEYP